MHNFSQSTNLIWSVADLLRGDFKQSEYGKVILPLTIIRRLDCVLEGTKNKVLAELPRVEQMNVQNIDPILNKISGYNFHNRSKFNFDKLIADPENIAANLSNYINGFSDNARDIIEHFKFDIQIAKLDDNNLLYMVVKRFQEIDLHPDVIDNTHMGYIYEELIRRFSELSNETAGEHFTPREVIRLMVNLLFLNDRDILTKKGIVKTLYDVCAGTGGMLSVAEEYLFELNKDARLEVFGQELNEESYAISKSDMLIKGQKPTNIKYGNSLSNDQLKGQQFDYMLTNPPFGVEWKKVKKEIVDEHEQLGFGGRFGAGLPRINDGSLLFLLHLISKMKQDNGGSRIGIVLNGSPLFTGGAGSGESNIRKWIIENDMLEAIIALPDQLFYNTGISTYIWLLSNKKEANRKGKVQMINAVSFYEKMPKSLGNKRHLITASQIDEITRLYGDFTEGKYCKIFNNEDFGYTRIAVERPLKDDDGNIVKDKKGNPKPDTSLRDNEDVPLKEDIEAYFLREVIPHVPDLPAPLPISGKFCVYVLLCSDGSFYKGQTDDLQRRLREHNNGKVSWTSKNLPVKLIHWEVFNTREQAVIREKYLKSGRGREWLNKQYNKGNLKAMERQAGAWIDHSKSKVGYEINFTRYFYEYKPLRSLEEIRADILALEEETEGMIRKVLE